MTTCNDHELKAEAVRYARVLPLDVVQKNGSGHGGTAVGVTPFLFTLFHEYLRHDPTDPSWLGRDRFVLSCGHASLALYLQLYLHGYGIEMSDMKATRKLDSITPGHPEWGQTPGVETTTGPLGQGFGNAVGMAMAARRVWGLLDHQTESWNSPFYHRVYCLASDGDIQEGVSHEAAALAGHLHLENLIVIWDDNQISIEGSTSVSTSEDVESRFAAYGWEVRTINDAESVEEIRDVLESTIHSSTGKPKFIRLRSRIGNPMPTIGGTGKAHAGAPGEEEIARTKELLGVPAHASFQMPSDVLNGVRQRSCERGRTMRTAWSDRFDRWSAENSVKKSQFDRMLKRELPEGWDASLPTFDLGQRIATRVASAQVLSELANTVDEFWGGSADLAETNGSWDSTVPSFLSPADLHNREWPGTPWGKVIHFGVREHGMGAILNGIALNGMTRPFGATFLTFSDYMRPAVRLAAIMRLPVLYIWTHDSVAVGEDGPTHEPVEQLWSCRAIPHLAMVRPADGNELVAAYRTILRNQQGPTALALSRQALPTLTTVQQANDGVERGGYIAEHAEGHVDAILIATGSELQVALEAKELLVDRDIGVNVVSMPCVEWFDEQSEEYQNKVLPPDVPARVSVEAGAAQGWYRFIGRMGVAVSVEDYGLSGNGAEILERKGITAWNVMNAVLRAIDNTTHINHSQSTSLLGASYE